MNYKVVHAFRDLQDEEGHVYLIGDVFPFDGYKGKVGEDRIKELSGSANKARKPVIVAVEEVVEKATMQVAAGTIEKAVAKKTTRKRTVKKETVEGE